MDTFKIKRGDTVPAIEAFLQYSNGSAVDLTTTTITFNMSNLIDYSPYRSGTAFIIGSETGDVRYPFSTEDTGSVGTFWGEFEVNWGAGSLMTLPNDHSLKIEVYEDYN